MKKLNKEIKPTDEQLEILKAFKEHDELKINAVSGSGKSSTLRLLAEDNNVPSLYICFNKQNATEASEKFPKHTECRTVHSLAYSVFGKHIAHKINTKDYKYINRGRTPKELVSLYNIDSYWFDNNEKIEARVIASLSKRAVNTYQNSADEQIEKHHINLKELKILDNPEIKKKEVDGLYKEVLKIARKLWKDKVNVKSPVKADHDTYQKLYQLSKPKLNYDVIYVDEFQDTNPVVLDIINNQKHCKRVYVGDTYQSIYAFRGAINAMEKVKCPTLLLSKSFRYGEEIASLATFIIDGKIHVKGNEEIQSSIVDTDNETISDLKQQYTYIFRTNSALLEEAVNLIGMGLKVRCEIDPKKFKSLIESSLALYSSDYSKIKDDEISVYTSFKDMMEDGKENPEVSRLVKIVLSGDSLKYIKALESVVKTKDSNNYDVLLTTAHKSKGLEWSNVVVANDFNCETLLKSEGDEWYNQQEINLFYVACTRAIHKLEIDEEYLEQYTKFKGI